MRSLWQMLYTKGSGEAHGGLPPETWSASSPGQFTPVPHRRLGGNQSPSGHFVKDNLLPLPVFELRLLCLAARSLVAILTELPQTHVFFVCTRYLSLI